MFTLTIELLDEIMHAKVNDVVYDVLVKNWPNVTRVKALGYGVQRLINDRHGGAIGEGEKWACI